MGAGLGPVGAVGKTPAAPPPQPREADPAAFDKATDAARGAPPPAGEAPPPGARPPAFSWSDFGHAALDVAGMVPGVGEVADLANAGWYAAEGDYGNAALSAASAIPFAGNLATGAKWAKRGIEAVDAATDIAKTADHAGDAAKISNKVDDGVKAVETTADAGKLPPPAAAREPAVVGAPARAQTGGANAPSAANGPAGGAGGKSPAAKNGTGGGDGPGGPGGPQGPGTPPGGAPSGPNGISFRTDLPSHLKGPDGFKGTNLKGTHNQDVAISEVKAKGFNPTVTPTGTKGVNEVKWDVPNPNDPSKPITRSKTTYDPAVFTDEKMLNMAQDAGQQGWAKHLQQPNQQTFDVKQDGVNFRVNINQDTAGNSFVGNVHPIP